MTIIEVFHCAYVSTGLRLATEYSFKSILTENIFKTFFILVTNSVIAVPDPVTQLRHEVDLALEKRVIQRRGTVRLRSSWHRSREALAIDAGCCSNFTGWTVETTMGT